MFDFNHSKRLSWPRAKPGMLTRPAGNEAKAEARKSEAEDQATMYEVKARHVREQLSVYEHED